MSGPPDLGANVESFGVPVVFRATGVATKNADGYKIPGAAVDVAGVAHVYPTPGHRREALPQGLQDGEIWSGGTIYPVSPATQGGARGTEVLWAGRVLEVIQVQHYTGPDGTGGYYEFEARAVSR